MIKEFRDFLLRGNLVELANGQITIKGVGLVQISAPVVTINGRVVAPVGPPI